MAFAKLYETKAGKQYYRIDITHGREGSRLSRRWYVPEGWSKKSIESELRNQIAEFQKQVDAGLILTRKEKAAAAEKAAKEKAAIEKAEAEARTRLKTLKQYAENVFMVDKEQSIAENTRLSYKHNLEKHILPALGADTLMTEVTPAMINSFISKFRENHSFSSTIKVYNVLNGIFSMALFDDTIPSSPMAKVKRPKQKKDDKAVTEADKAFTAEELNYILDCVSKEPIKWQAFIFLAADTGSRRGELCGLEWKDIDFKSATVRIEHNLQYSPSKGVYDAAPKGGAY